jgi:signal transduction histidine kinase
MSGKKPSKKREQAREFIKLLKAGKIPPNVHRNFILKHLKYTLTRSEAEKIIQIVSDDQFDYISAYPIANQYNELFKEPGPYLRTPGKEIIWVYNFLIDYTDELNEFVKLEIEYSKYFLLGDFQKAREIVEKIESDISVSVWGMQQKILLAEMERGFAGNKDLLSQFLNDKISSLTTFVVHYTSIRAEKNISATQFEDFIDKYLEAAGSSLEEYAYFKVDFFRKLKYNDPEFILYIDGRFSIVDRFITFKQLAKLSLCEKGKESQPDLWQQYIAKLSTAINDPELNVLSNLYGIFKPVSENDTMFSALLDAYSSNKYSKVVSIAEELILIDPRSYHTILLYVKAVINLDIVPKRFGREGCILDQIIVSLNILLSKNKKFTQESYSDIYKILHQLGNHPLAIGLFQTFNEELPYKFQVYHEIDFFKLYIASSTMNNPAFYQFLPKKNQESYLKNFEKLNTENSTLKIINSISKTSINLTDLSNYSVRELKYRAIVFRNDGKQSDALKIYDHILESEEFKSYIGSAHFVLDILVGNFNCLIQLGRFGDAIELAVDSIEMNQNFRERFFNPDLLGSIINTEDETLQGNVCLPIYLAYYKSNIEPYDLYVGYDNYMDILGYEKPRDLILAYDTYDKRDLNFLLTVCTHDVLHSSPAFENQEELDLERLEICNFLVGKLGDHSEVETEVSDLLRKILVRKGIKQVNYSKIYVDVPSLRESLQKELRENFNRNIEIAALPIDQLNKIVDSLGNMLVYYVDNPDENQEPNEDDLENVKLTSYNRFLHFKEAFLKVRDRFISDKDHGLDTYLSMRIRHGTLSGQIRSVFETNHLITVRNEIDNAYLSNDFWLNRLTDLEPENHEKLDEALNNFSQEIDEIAEILKMQTIQITTEKNKATNGLFDFAYSEKELLELFSTKFGSIKEYENFIDHVIFELWARTEHCLTSIKEYLKNQLTEKFTLVFDKLEDAINKIKPTDGPNISHILQELISTITNCRTAIVVEIGNISEWFNRSSKKFIDEFDFSVLAASSVNTLQTIKPLFKDADIKYDIKCDLKFDGDLFPYFTDILYYLLDNAIKHSKLASEELWVTINITQEGEKIKFVVVNNILNDDAYAEKVKERIISTREKIKADVTYDRINKEGGTGFPKIKKTLKHDLKRKVNTLNLDLEEIDGQRCFISTITFDVTGLKIIE